MKCRVGEVYQTAFYGLPSDVAVVGVWREGMLYLTNTLSGVGALYQTAFYGLPSDVPVVGVWREGMLYLTNTLSGVGEVHQTAFYELPSDVAVVGVWREGMLYLTNTLSGMGEVYQTVFYELPSDVPVVGVWRESVGNADPACAIQITATPIATFTPMPNPCKVIVKPNTTAYFRHQPFLDNRSALDSNGENWLLSYDGVTLLRSPRPWLWQTGQLPQVIDVNTLLAVSVAQVPWDLPSPDAWLQVRVPIVTNGVAAEVWAWTTTQEVNLADPTGCPLVNVPQPDASMTSVPRGTFNQIDQSAIFDSVPPAVIGDCRLHRGLCIIPTPPVLPGTLDIVPRNIEMCIDSRNSNPNSPQDKLHECDPRNLNLGIEVRSPVSGCMIYDPPSETLVIEYIPDNHAAPGYLDGCKLTNILAEPITRRYQIAFTHLNDLSLASGKPSNWIVVSRGQLLGRLCTRFEWLQTANTNSRLCAAGSVGLIANAPQHLAVDLRVVAAYNGAGLANMQGFIAYPYCIYDDWSSQNNNQYVIQPLPREFHVCP